MNTEEPSVIELDKEFQTERLPPSLLTKLLNNIGRTGSQAAIDRLNTEIKYLHGEAIKKKSTEERLASTEKINEVNRDKLTK